MDAREQRAYRDSIAREIEDWAPDADPADPWWPLVRRTPEWFDALVNLSAEEALGDAQRRIVRRVIKYLISPLDLCPEFIYGPEGFREDLALIGWGLETLAGRLEPAMLERHGLAPYSAYWQEVRERGESDLDESLRRHLKALLNADSVAGDEDLGWTDTDTELIAPAPDVSHGGHTMVFAGPGTGKTYCIEQELWRLLRQENVPPEQLLVTTFTNKAADELRLRVHSTLRKNNVKEADAILQRLAISTIHSFCFRLISRFHHHALFLKGTFSPMDTTQRMLFLFRHGHALNVFPIYEDWKEARRQESQWSPSDLFHFYAYVGEIYDFLSEDVLRGVEPGLRHRYLQIIHNRGGNTVDERIIARYPAYWQLIQDEGFLDHSMQLAYAEALLDDPQVRRHVQGTYRHVLVDEYQDTNPIQDRIFRAIVGNCGHLFAVGDDDQSIYAFRGADVRNATEFPKRWPGTHIRKLEENRRSTQALLAAFSELIAHNKARQAKSLHTKNAAGVPPWRLEAEEARLADELAKLLDTMHRSGAIENWRDVAILFRSLNQTVPRYLEALHGRGIPAQVSGDHRFLKEPVVRSFLETLKMLVDGPPAPTRRQRKHRAWFEALDINDYEKIAGLMRGWHERLTAGRYKSFLDLFYAMLHDSGAVESNALLPAMGRLSAFMADAESQLRSPKIIKRLSFFNSYAAAVSSAYEGPEEHSQDAVSLMTIHKAKGLEFPVVVIGDANEGSLPAHFPINIRTRLRRDLAGIETRLDPEEEERRTLYVGMTRARAYLILAAAKGKASPFLSEFRHDPAPTDGPIPKFTVDAYGKRSRPEPPFHEHHSAIYNYHFCPRRYLLESRYGFAGRPITPLRTGQSLHRALEIYHRLRRDKEQVTADRRELIFERAWLRPRSKEAANAERNELFRVFREYVAQWEAGEQERGLRTIEVERPFFVAEGRGVLTGRIDLVRECEGRLEIVEFKYHRNPMLPDYPRRQLEHYSLAYPTEEPALVVHYLKEAQEESISRRPPEPVREELDSVFNSIARREFDAKPAKRTCRLCPVRFACSACAVPRAA